MRQPKSLGLTALAAIFAPGLLTAAPLRPPRAGPRFRLTASAAEVATRESAFAPFAREVSAAVPGLLAAIDPRDLGRLELLLALRVHLGVHEGCARSALDAAARLRALQPTAALRECTGVLTDALVAARRSSGARPGQPGYATAFARIFATRLRALPRGGVVCAWLRSQRREYAALNRRAILDGLRGIPSGMAGSPGSCTLEEAARLVRARHKLADILPIQSRIVADLDAAIAARASPPSPSPNSHPLLPSP